MRCIKLPGFQNVTANSKVSLRLPLGQVYEKIYINLTGTGITKALMSNLVLRLNNKEFQRWASIGDLDTINTYKGNSVTANFVVIDFTERKAREEVAMKLGTVAATAEAGVQDFTLEFDLGAATITGTISAWADVDVPSANSVITRVMMSQKVIAGAAEEQIYLPFGAQGLQIKRILIKNTNLSECRVRRDGVEIYESLPVALQNFRAADFGQTPVAGFHVVDFMPDTLQSNALNTAFTIVPDGQGGRKPVPVANLDIRLKTSAADTLTIYAEAYSLNGQL